MNLQDFIGKNPTPSARLSSAIISLVLLVSIIFRLMPPEYVQYALYFLLFHLVNHLYVGFSEITIYACPTCGAILKPKLTYEKHVCKKTK